MSTSVVILGALVGCSLTTIAGFALWFLTRPFSRGLRIAMRVLCGPALLFVFSHAWLFGMSFGERGRWMCFVCGAVERRTEFLGVPIYRTDDVAGETGVAESREYEAWFREHVGIEHEHAWTPVGCHGVGASMTMCYGTYGESWGYALYTCLERMPDPEILAFLMDRWIHAAREDRYGMIRDFELGSLERPFGEIHDGEELQGPVLRASFQGWLDRHPDWR